MTRVVRSREATRLIKRRVVGRQALRRAAGRIRSCRRATAHAPYVFAGTVLRVKRRGVHHSR